MSARSSLEFRRASESDLAAEYAVWVTAREELSSRCGVDWSAPAFDPAGRWAQIHRHLLAHDRERAFLAAEHGRVVGFTAAFVRDDFWYFAALFVDPAWQGRGIGRRLLDLAWDGPHARRVTITEAIQPVSTGLYAQRGLLPVTPVLGFTGRPVIDPGADALEPTAPTADGLRAIDLAAYGFDRRVDHEFWTRTSARACMWLQDGEPCSYSYRGGLFGTGPVAGADPASAARALCAELAESAHEETSVYIPGTATALVQVALDAGLRLENPGLLLLSPPKLPPTAYAIHSYWLL